MPDPQHRLLYRTAVAVLALAALAWGLVSLTYPLGPDQGIYAWLGMVIRDGGLPYRDAWEIKGPTHFYHYATAQLLFGHNTWAARLLDFLLLSAAAITLARGAGRLLGEAAGIATAALCFFWYAHTPCGSIAQADSLVALLLVFAYAPLLAPRQPPVWRFAMAGVLISLCTLTKPFYGLFLLPPALLAFGKKDGGVRAARLPLLVLAAGFAVPFLAFLALFSAWGIVGDFLDAHILYNFTVYTPGTTRLAYDLAGRALYYVKANPPLNTGLLPLLAGCFVLWRRDRGRCLFVLLWLLFALAIVLVQRRLYDHHWVPLLPPAAILVTTGLLGWPASQQVGTERRTRALRAAGAAFFAIVLGATALRPALHVLHWAEYATGRMSEATYLDRLGGAWGTGFMSFRAEREVARFVASRSRPGDKVFVWGFTGIVNYISDRASPTRWVYPPDVFGHDAGAVGARYRAELTADLLTHPPTYFVVAHADNAARLGEAPLAPLDRAPGVRELVRTNYRKEIEIERFDVYRIVATR